MKRPGVWPMLAAAGDRVGRYPAKGGRAMTVGRNPYRGPAPACVPLPIPASGIPPSRFPGPPAASGAALMVLTGTAAWPSAGAAPAPVHATGTDNLPPMEAAPPKAAAGWTAPPPSSAAQPAQRGQGLGGGRGRPADQPQSLGHLHAEVAHTDTEVRQTLGVVEQAREGGVAVDSGSQVGGQGRSGPVNRNQSSVSRRRWSWWRPRAGWPRLCSVLGVDGDHLRQRGLRGARRGARGVGDRGALGGLGGRVGDLGCRGKRGHLGRRRRLTRIAIHRGGILGPHLRRTGPPAARSTRCFDPTHWSPSTAADSRTVGRHQRRGHRCSQRGLIGRRGRLRLGGRLLGLGGRRGHPRHIRLPPPRPSTPTPAPATPHC